MTQNGKVFISGSRNQLKLTESILKTLDTLVAKNFDILIGDSEKGVDSEVLNYLMENNPKSKVTVFTIKDKPVKLFYVYGGKMLNSDLKTLNDLVMVIESYQSEILTKEEKANIIKAKNNSNLIDLNQIKYEILNKKFNKLMKTEIQIKEARSSFNLKTHEQLKLF